MKIQICLIDFIKGELIGTEENKAAEVSEYQFEWLLNKRVPLNAM